MRKLMVSCEIATELMEKKLRKELSVSEKLKLLAHKTLCDACSQYEKQSIFMEQLFQSKKADEEEEQIDGRVENLQKKVLEKLDEKP